MNQIRNLADLLQLRKNEIIINYKTSQLIGPNENYGSTMSALEVNVQNLESNETRQLRCVAKTCPTSEFVKRIFSTHITFRKEVRFYDTIVPMLRNFQEERGMSDAMSFFPKCYGSRVNLKANSNVVDDDAAILLENLKLSGYDVADRLSGFDLQPAVLVIEDLAVFHAVPIALKLSKPEYFQSALLPLLEKNDNFHFDDDTNSKIIDQVVTTVRQHNFTESIVERVKTGLRRGMAHFKNPAEPTGPFTTIVHNDFWVNNTMLKGENGKFVKNVMVDFQMIAYDSLAHDVIFFLMSSVNLTVLEKHYEMLLRVYYNKFIETLQELRCATDMFTYRLFLDELDEVAKIAQVFHVLFMLKPIHTLKSQMSNMQDFDEKEMLREDHLSENFGLNMAKVVKHFVNMGWI